MRFIDPASLALLAVAAVLGILAFAVARRRHHRALAAARRDRDRALDGEQAATRLLRLAAHELRGPAMTLLGHADQLGKCGPSAKLNSNDCDAAVPNSLTPGSLTPGSPTPDSPTPDSPASAISRHAAAIAAVTAQILNLADDLQDHALPEPATRVLREEPIALEALLRDAIAAVNATLGPSQRHWRQAPGIAATRLLADRRALAQVLVRVLGNAARLSRDQDWIDIGLSWIESADGACIALSIEDEGTGLLAASDTQAAPSHPASRGIGMGLALARTLMQAHDGDLVVQSTAQVGTSVMLSFPIDRVLRTGMETAAAKPSAPLPQRSHSTPSIRAPMMIR